MQASDVDWSGRRLHFIAIGGAGMSGLALVAHALGASVTGSDRAESSYMDRLRAAGLEPRFGHHAGAVPEDAEVVVSTAVPDDNVELTRARERGQRVLHRGELLAELCAAKRTLAVAGTHGKTTTAAMIVHAMRAAGADPAFVLGGELAGAGPGGEATNAGWGAGAWMVAEADESDASFLRLAPAVALVTNVELDHHSHWSSLASMLSAFGEFCASAGGGLGVWDRPELSSLRPAGEGRLLRFGIGEGPGPPGAGPQGGEGEALIATGVEPGPEGGSSFGLLFGGKKLELTLGVPGRHNVLNALAALAGMALAGVEPARAAGGLASFPGVVRRFELKGRTPGGARVYDDYAHHPTEVRATLEAARELGPGRLVAIFQPHLYSRTKRLAREFGSALALADEVAVLDVYPARELPEGELAGVSGRMVAEAAADRAGGRPVWWLPSAADAARALAPRLGEGDLVLTLGAGDIDRLAEALVGGHT